MMCPDPRGGVAPKEGRETRKWTILQNHPFTARIDQDSGIPLRLGESIQVVEIAALRDESHNRASAARAAQRYAQASEHYREALEQVRERCGAVCPEYETCTHPWCAASYTAWALADEALAYNGDSDDS
jgi:hypothetical protein